jgi:hypothetical protein
LSRFKQYSVASGGAETPPARPTRRDAVLALLVCVSVNAVFSTGYALGAHDKHPSLAGVIAAGVFLSLFFFVLYLWQAAAPKERA